MREEAPAELAASALKERAAVMFSGNSGAPVASGEAAAAKEPTFLLIRDAWTAIESLPAALFEKHAQHRPCGLLDQYEAVAMLIADVLGEPLLPQGELSRAVGLKAYKLRGKIAAEVGKAKRAAQRKGEDPARAEAGVLGAAVPLPLPSAEECREARIALGSAENERPRDRPRTPHLRRRHRRQCRKGSTRSDRRGGS